MKRFVFSLISIFFISQSGISQTIHCIDTGNRDDTAIYGPKIIGAEMTSGKIITDAMAREYSRNLLASLPISNKPNNHLKKGWLLVDAHGPDPALGRRIALRVALGDFDDCKGVIFFSCAGKAENTDCNTHRVFADHLAKLRNAGITEKRLPAIGAITNSRVPSGLVDGAEFGGRYLVESGWGEPNTMRGVLQVSYWDFKDKIAMTGKKLVTYYQELDSSDAWEVVYEPGRTKQLKSDRFFGVNNSDNFKYDEGGTFSPFSTNKCASECESPAIQKSIVRTKSTPPVGGKTSYLSGAGTGGRVMGGGLIAIVQWHENWKWQERAYNGDELAKKYLKSQDNMRKLEQGIGLEQYPWYMQILGQGGAYMMNGGLNSLP